MGSRSLGVWRLFGLGACVAAIVAGALLYTPDRDRDWLERRYLRSPSDYLNLDGQILHVRVEGAEIAPPILLLHGLGASLHTFEPWAAALAKDYRVISMDLPGHGLSGPDPTGDYSIDRSIKLVEAVMDRLAPGPVILVGHSIGGQIAWRIAAGKPDRVSRLILIAPAGFSSSDQTYDEGLAVPAWASIAEVVLPRFLIAQAVGGAYGDQTRLTDAVIDRYWNLIRAPGNRTALFARLRQYRIIDPVPLLHAITAPTLLMWGVRDQMVPLSNMDDYKRELSDVRTVTYSDMGHVPMEEGPDKSLADLRAFLSGAQGSITTLPITLR